MYRKYRTFLSGLAIMSLAAVAPSSGWAQGEPVNLTPGFRADFLAWSPDGTKIAFASFGVDGNYDIFVMDASGDNPVNLTQSDGSDRKPAWSPDGTRIVFYSDRDGDQENIDYDIYVMDANGDNLVRLTRGGDAQEPVWSPDGTKIAFRDSGASFGIYVMDANGDNPVLIPSVFRDGANPAWSPDGTKIVFDSSRDGDREIYVMDANRDNPVRLTRSDGYDANPAWSPDGTKIVFESFRDRDREIYVMDANGDNPVRLTRSDGYDANPVWSPDGTKIAFTSSRRGDFREGIYVLPYEPPAAPTEHGDTRERATAVGPDSTTPGALEQPGDVDYFRVDVPGAGRLIVATTGRVADTFGIFQSAEGRSIAENDDAGTGNNFLISRDVTHGRYYVAVRGVSRSETGVYTLRLAFAPFRGRVQGGLVVGRPNPVDSLSLWNLGTDRTPSPDGTKYVLTSGSSLSDPYRGKLMMFNADGTNPVQLTPDNVFAVRSRGVAWSPDGTKIAFAGEGVQLSTSIPVLSSSIYVINADGTNLVWLGPDECYGPCVKNHPHLDLSHDPHPRYPAWSPDGTKIAFTANRLVPDYYDARDGGEREQKTAQDIFVMNADGTNLVRLTNSSKKRNLLWSSSRFPAWSPDGRWLAFVSNRDDLTPREGIYLANSDGTNPVRIGDCNDCYWLAWSPDGRLLSYNHFGPSWRYDYYAITLTERGDRRATLLNLSPWQAWVHLYCLKDHGAGADPPAPCAVTFECNGQSGEPASWPVEVAPKTIFSYWPNKTAPDGTDADLHAALIAAGKMEDEARRRTTCEVFSPDPLTVRGYTLFGGQPTLVPVAEPARPAVAAEPGERRRRATLPNLSPGQAWVHLYCLKDRDPDAAPCAVTFECNGLSGEPVSWPVEVGPKTIFSYWPNKTVDGLSADLQAALIAAGKPEDEARRRTTCEVSSADPIAVRGYTRFGGQPTLVPVPAYQLSR